jgi:hypothetical protein
MLPVSFAGNKSLFGYLEPVNEKRVRRIENSKGQRLSAPAVLPRMVERAGMEAKLGFKVHPHMLRHACGYALANRGGTIREPFRRGSGTGTFSIRCATLSYRRRGSRISGGSECHADAEGCQTVSFRRAMKAFLSGRRAPCQEPPVRIRAKYRRSSIRFREGSCGQQSGTSGSAQPSRASQG